MQPASVEPIVFPSRMIPKVIIQTGPPKLPLLLRSAIVNVKLLHPGFKHVFFDDAMIESFLADHFPEYVTEYHSFRFRIQKYDFFRYLAIYKVGGFYLDLDVFLAQELNPLLDSECVFAFEELAEARYFWDEWQMDWQIGNYAFGAEPGNAFLAAIIENCLRAKREPEWVRPMMKGIPSSVRDDFYVLNTTGPGMVSRTLAENPQLASRINILFPDDVCERRTWHHFGAYGVHNMAGSWREPAKVLARIQTRMWGHLTQRRMMANGRLRGRTRTVETRPRTSLAAGTKASG